MVGRTAWTRFIHNLPGSQAIANEKDLTRLELRGDAIDVELMRLREFRRLRGLSLRHATITEASLEQLKQLTQLRTLNLRDTDVSVKEVKNLQQALPKCGIVR